MKTLFTAQTDNVTLTWSRRGADPPVIGPLTMPPGRLVLRPRRAGLVFGTGTWRADVPELLTGSADSTIGPRLLEHVDYTVLLRSLSSGVVELRHRDPALLQGMATSGEGRLQHGSINFRSQIGRSTFTVWVDGKPEFDFEVEIFPTKLDYTTDYAELLAEVQDILTGLVVEYLRATFQQGGSDPHRNRTHVEWLTLLRHVLEDLEQAITQIARRPIRGLSRQAEFARVERLRRADAAVRRAVLRGRGAGPLQPLRTGIMVRQRVQEQRPRPTLDTAEHRWLAAQLTLIRRRLAQLRETELARQTPRVGEPHSRQQQIIAELTHMESRITRLERLEPFVAAAGSPPPGFASLQLLTTPGYREAYRAVLLLSLGLRIRGGGLELSVKDLHLLYEYWCYLAVLRLVAEITGQRIPARDLLSVQQDGLRVRVEKGRQHNVEFRATGGRRVVATYNPQFSGDSLLFAQQPDVVLSIEDPEWPPIRLVIDAKYRLDTSPEYSARYGVPGPPADAVNVLHRYRDALLETAAGGAERPKRTVVEGAVLYPLRPDAVAYRGSRLWSALERLGIGAVPFLPGETTHAEEWLRSVLQRGGWELASRAIAHRSQDHLREWRHAAGESVLIAVLRGRGYEAEHLDWIRNERLYYTPLTRQPRQHVVRWLAVYSPGALRQPGAVTHVAPVVSMDVLPRREIATPWMAHRTADELQAVYRTGPLMEIQKPIENRGENGSRGRSFTSPRWTSRLALERANELRELLLETEPEWQLYDGLRAAGIVFEVVPGRVDAQDPDDPRGRAWFRTEGGSIQYKGAAGFLMKTVLGDDRWIGRAVEVVDALAGLSS
jgi:uncharacterized protein